MLADAATWLDAATLMTLRAAYLKESRQPFSQQAAMAKLFATEHAWKICDIALQVHGGYGYVATSPSSARCATCASRGSTRARARSSAS